MLFMPLQCLALHSTPLPRNAGACCAVPCRCPVVPRLAVAGFDLSPGTVQAVRVGSVYEVDGCGGHTASASRSFSISSAVLSHFAPLRRLHRLHERTNNHRSSLISHLRTGRIWRSMILICIFTLSLHTYTQVASGLLDTYTGIIASHFAPAYRFCIGKRQQILVPPTMQF